VVDAEMLTFEPRSAAFRADPYPAYHRLRAKAPVYYRSTRDDWLLTRYADTLAVLKDRRFGRGQPEFPAAEGLWGDRPTAAIDCLRRLRSENQQLMRLWLPLQNPPAHTRLRQVMHDAFMPHAIAALRPRIAAIVDELIDRAQAAGHMDVINDLASPLPERVMWEILGVPERERCALSTEVANLAMATDVDVTSIGQERGLLALSRLASTFRRLIDSRSKHPASENGLLTRMVNALDHGQLNAHELLANCVLLFFSGQVTTTHLIGNGLLALLWHPDQLSLLLQHPGIIHSAIEEMLRYDTPLQVATRVASEDVRWGDQRIGRGQRVHLVLGAANRDPEQFPEPDRFDIRRDPNRHLAFGHGLHACLGLHLTRVEAEVALSRILHRLPNLTLENDEPEWEDTFMIHGLKSLPVCFAERH
jgi:cytochrome P450